MDYGPNLYLSVWTYTDDDRCVQAGKRYFISSATLPVIGLNPWESFSQIILYHSLS